tara:strand:+ start:4401 stop:4697 length:297 start_codon:yes stop_codon:yes gene_type:complete
MVGKCLGNKIINADGFDKMCNNLLQYGMDCKNIAVKINEKKEEIKMKKVLDLTDVIDMLKNIDTFKLSNWSTAGAVEMENEIKKVIDQLFLLMMKFNK